MTTLHSPAPLAPYTLDFELPSALETRQPPEARGLARDAVKLMVSYESDNRLSAVGCRLSAIGYRLSAIGQNGWQQNRNVQGLFREQQS